MSSVGNDFEDDGSPSSDGRLLAGWINDELIHFGETAEKLGIAWAFSSSNR